MEVTDYVDDDYGSRIENRREYKNKLQGEYFEMVKAFDNDIVKLWHKDKSKALRDISQFNKMILKKPWKVIMII